MIKQFKKQGATPLGVLVFLLTLSCLCSTCVTPVCAIEENIQEKGINILNEVVDLDLKKYETTTKEYQNEEPLKYMGVIPQKSVDYTLSSADSKLRFLCTFTKGKLQMVQVLENEGKPSLTRGEASTNTVVAKNVLHNYQTYTDNPVYGELEKMLEDVDPNKNITKKSENKILEVSVIDGQTIFKWYYTANGAVAPYSKFIAISVKNCFLTAFVDNWQLYEVATTNVNLSKDEAISIALDAAKDHSWSVELDTDTLDLKNFNASNVRWTTLVLDGSLDADNERNDDPLTLYPVWRVGIALDKWYGYMYGIQIDVWADTKEIRLTKEAWSSILPKEMNLTVDVDDQELLISESEFNVVALIGIPAIAISVFGTAVFLVNSQKKPHKGLLKNKGFKTCTILLCLLVISPVALGTIGTVNATVGAVVWGSESTGSGAYPNSWRKSQNEIDTQRLTAEYLEDYFIVGGYTGYNGINHQGINNPGSSAGQILNYDLPQLQSSNTKVAVVDFNHGVGGYPPVGAPPNEQHYMFEDNTGTVIGTQQNHYTDYNYGVFDMYIYPVVQAGKINLAYISACQSANITRLGQGMLPANPPYYYSRAIGMPFAWTHRLVMDKDTPGFTTAQHISDDGYGKPDTGTQVYIGFPDGSASLEQGIPFGYGNPYYYWVCSFFGNALYYDVSVNQALNSASWQFMGTSFAGTQLRTGFTCYWWNFPTYDGNTLAIYGNGNIHIKY